jgi:hypothetical protein
MGSDFSLTSEIYKTRVFECPQCKETIDAAQKQCRFCGAPIDAEAAAKAAEVMARVNQACSDASYLRIAAVATLVFLGMMFLPFLSWYGTWGFYILVVAVPVMAIRWWGRFFRIETEDHDFIRARRVVAVISLLVFFPFVRILLGVAAGVYGLFAR